MYEEYQLKPRRHYEHVGLQFAHVGTKDFFKSLLEFTAWSLHCIDRESDNRFWFDVIEKSMCLPMTLADAQLRARQFIDECIGRYPTYLTSFAERAQFLDVYQGWIEVKSIYHNLRGTMVGQSGARFIAFHSRASL